MPERAEGKKVNEFDKALRYIFVLSFVLILVAYYLGSTQVLNALGSNSTGLINTLTGRTANGQFAGYAH